MICTKTALAFLALNAVFCGCINPEFSHITFNATEYGITADGKTDDAPAILKLLEKVSDATNPVTIVFPENSSIYAASATNRYLFPLTGFKDVTVNGNGSTFLLDPDIRFMNMRGCTNITFKNLKVDFTPLPFADGTIIAKSEKERWVDVRLLHGNPAQLCGAPTKEDGEQAFFSMLWNDGPYDLISEHYWTRLTEKLPESNCVRVHCENNFTQFKFIEPGKTRISIPVPGIAHRYGPGGCFDIFDNTDVSFANIELWSAPWFGFRILRNEGKVEFTNVNIRSKPETERLTSTWRDGFHVKGNRASLLWENCTLTGMNDDAFNISTHCRAVTKIESPTRFVTHQRYPLNPIPWRIGDEMVAVNPETLQIRGRAIVTKIDSETRMLGERPAAPMLTIETDKPIMNLNAGDTIWQPASTNPDTTLRNCTIKKSCRMQCSLTMESCAVTALLWFYSEDIEGPGPQSVSIRNCTLHRGRGNAQNAVIFSGAPKDKNSDSAKLTPRLLQSVDLTGNQIYGGLSLKGVENIFMLNNQFLEKDAPVIIENNR